MAESGDFSRRGSSERSRIETWFGAIDVDGLLQTAAIPVDSLLIVSGSLVEGHGNPFSDIDVICITEHRPTLADLRSKDFLIVQLGAAADIVGASLMGEEARRSTATDDSQVVAIHDYADAWGTRFEVEFVHPSLVRDLAGKLVHHVRKIERSYGSAPLPMRFVDARLLDRLLVGRPLNRAAEYRELVAAIPRLELSYSLYRAAFMDYAGFQDVLGAARAERWPMAVQLARGFLLRNVKAWLHLSGVTNPNDKWVTVYLKKVGTPDPALYGAVEQAVLPGAIDDPCRFVVHCLDTADRFLDQSLDLLAGEPRYPAPERILANIRQRIQSMGRTDAHMRLGMEYYAKAGTRSALALREFLSKPQGLDRNCFE